MIKTILGGILLQILNMQAIYHLNKNAHFGSTKNFYRHMTTYEQAHAWLKPLFRFWKQHHRVLKAALYLQWLQIAAILCDLILIPVAMIHGFSDMVKLIMLGSNVGVVLLIIMCNLIYTGRY